MGKVANRKKPCKSKAKEKKKELQIGPKIRLEPRLTPKSTKVKKECKQEADENLQPLKTNDINLNPVVKIEDMHFAGNSSEFPKTDIDEKSIFLTTSTCGSSEQMMIDAGSSNIIFGSLTSEENNQDATTEDNLASKDGIEDDEESERLSKQSKKPLTPKSTFWSDRELMNLAVGLQNEGFADLKKVAEYVETKNENEIFMYLKKRSLEAYKAEHPNLPRGRPNTWNTLSPENIATWPNIRKWRKLAYNQMLSLVRSKDYSKTVILSLCKKFYEEEKEPPDPQVINVKMIYKYILDCMSGEIPAQLPPKESALVLDLFREVRLMPLTCDFEEELKFLKGFKQATRFKPFEVKDEFKKRFKKSQDDEGQGSNTVSVPEEVFMDLSRHKKLVQSFNPLVTPVWMLQKEQEELEKYFEETNIF